MQLFVIEIKLYLLCRGLLATITQKVVTNIAVVAKRKIAGFPLK